MMIGRIIEYFERILNEDYKTSTYEILNKHYQMELELLNTIFESLKNNVGIADSKTGWYKPNIKHMNTGNNIKRNCYINYRLRNTPRLPRDSYYRVKR